MVGATVSVVIQQRDRFSLTEAALTTFFEHTPADVPVVYVDGGSPSPVKQYLESQANRRGFRLLRQDAFLAPNQARNLAIPHIHTPYVVFLDNDVLVQPGWLERLVSRAQSERAALVGPLYMEDGEQGYRVHMAGGEAHFDATPQGRRFIERHYLYGVALDEVAAHLQCVPTEMLEFHCLCVETDVLEQLGGFDESFLSCRDAIDLCLQVQRMDRSILLEPAARVTFLKPPPLAACDRDFFWLRWSDGWNRTSLDHFKTKWQLSDDDPSYADHMNWLTTQRRQLFEPVRRKLRPLGRGLVRFVDKRLMGPAECVWNRRALSHRKAA